MNYRSYIYYYYYFYTDILFINILHIIIIKLSYKNIVILQSLYIIVYFQLLTI